VIVSPSPSSSPRQLRAPSFLLPRFLPVLLLSLLLLLLRLPLSTTAAAAATSPVAGIGMQPPSPPAPAVTPPSVLVLDVDGTLYDASTGLEAEVSKQGGRGFRIESNEATGLDTQLQSDGLPGAKSTSHRSSSHHTTHPPHLCQIKQIAARIKRYCHQTFGTTDEECDALHHT
jgi:hypothetical protein